VKDDTVIEFDVAVGGTADETGGINAVVTAHGVKEQEGVWEASPLHLAHATPFDVGGVIVLLIARNFTAAASDTFGGIEMETVLFPHTQRRNIDTVVSTLHSGSGFIPDKALQWC